MLVPALSGIFVIPHISNVGQVSGIIEIVLSIRLTDSPLNHASAISQLLDRIYPKH